MEPLWGKTPDHIAFRIAMEANGSDTTNNINKSFREQVDVLCRTISLPTEEDILEYIEGDAHVGYWIPNEKQSEEENGVVSYGITGKTESLLVVADPYSIDCSVKLIPHVVLDGKNLESAGIDYVNTINIMLDKAGVHRDNARIVATVVEGVVFKEIRRVIDAEFEIPALCYWIALNLEILESSEPSWDVIRKNARDMMNDISSTVDSSLSDTEDEYLPAIEEKFDALKSKLRQYILSTVDMIADS